VSATFVEFDLLMQAGRNLRHLSYRKRHRRMRRLLADTCYRWR